ncbi:hypothetical protein AAW51_0421 [Caldimonas brevitalea]|uniref:CAAX prenyl protease 2/Lysostaphin resistance protein A-like domain-containing protein n=1 Tax=Caldimonas brevitalea TaxID=413882 RepID=A0A0G3BCR1_9BURK|nr:hypothetical protein AAW51_0421 [Caldimonas brevitalea]
MALQILVALGALALAMHAIPGFNNPVLADQVRISPDAAPYTLRANFDKGTAGLLLLVLFTTPIASLEQWRRVLPPTLLGAVATASIVIGIALVIGYVRPDAKVPEMAPYFLAINLLFTCIPEEAFFRGLLQERISSSRLGQAAGVWLPVAASTLLFGVVHFGGGPVFLALATVAGLGYSLAYQVTRRIEVAILVHFGVNAIHFFGFTYPYLGR